MARLLVAFEPVHRSPASTGELSVARVPALAVLHDRSGRCRPTRPPQATTEDSPPRRGTSRTRMPSYPRQQQYARLARAGLVSTLSVVAVLLAVPVAARGETTLAAALLLTAVGFGLRSRHWARLAARARVGARSEDQVHRALARLEAEGWRLHHSLPWPGRGDIDSIAIAPTGFAFTIETKTRTYTPDHLARVRGTAAWLTKRRRRWCRNGALPVLCVVCERGCERVEAGVLVVSIDRLPAALRTAAGTRQRPPFLSPASRRRTTV